MSATITDYFNKASNMSGSYPAVATVTAARSTGGSILSCDDLSSWTTDTPVHFSTFKVNTDGSIGTATQTDWKGIVNGNTITDMTRLAGAADSGNASGDRVELNPTVGWLDDLITGILVSHKQNGALKDNAVTESSIATGAVTNTKLSDGSVTSAKIATGAISSYDKIGDDVIQARNIDSASLPGKTFTSQSFSSTKSVGSTWTDFNTYTVPSTGLYFLGLSFNNGSSGSTKSRGDSRILLNSTVIVEVSRWSFTAWSGNNFAEGNTSIVAWLEAGDILKTQGKNQNWTGSLTVRTQIQQIY